MNMRITKWFCILIMSLMSHTMQTKVHCAKTEKRFTNLLLSKELSLVYFYTYDKHDKDNCSCDCSADLHTIFKATSNLPRYKSANVVFIEANVALPTLACIAQEYTLNTPSFMIFKDGAPYVKESMQACLQDATTKADLISFIDGNIGEDIQKILQEKEAIRRRNLEENLLWYNYYGFPWYGYCRPWYGSYYYGPSYGYPWYNSCGGTSTYLNFGVNVCR